MPKAKGKASKGKARGRREREPSDSEAEDAAQAELARKQQREEQTAHLRNRVARCGACQRALLKCVCKRSAQRVKASRLYRSATLKSRVRAPDPDVYRYFQSFSTSGSASNGGNLTEDEESGQEEDDDELEEVLAKLELEGEMVEPGDWPEDVLDLVCTHVPEEDLPAFALTCKAFRQAQLRTKRRLRVTAVALTRSPSLLQWGIRVWGDNVRKRACEAAARNGCWLTLQMARAEGCPWGRAIEEAAGSGHLVALKYAREHEAPGWGPLAWCAAALKGQMKCLGYLLEEQCAWDHRVCAAAARGGQLGALQWLRSHCCPWGESTCMAAAATGQLETLAWAREHGCNWSWKSFAYAAARGHIEVLEYLYVNRCSWTPMVCAWASREGQLEALQWLRYPKAIVSC
mmetsp:Transcript_2282/g.8154  ORF Transcript_2282/g.8154 Transcript_2282/m.8154 type:complete len:403 (+) Transcript_2282:207-1415(+)